MIENLDIYIDASDKAFGDQSDKNGYDLLSNYKFEGRAHKTLSGFHGTYYKSGNHIIMAFAGAEKLNDYISMGYLMSGKLTKQAAEAIEWYYEIKRQNPDCEITVTGGSLGGTIAQLVGAVTGCDAVTFNAYGCKEILSSLGFDSDMPCPNVVNYRGSTDILYLFQKQSSEQCIGTTYIVSTLGKAPIAAHRNLWDLYQTNPRNYIPSQSYEDGRSFILFYNPNCTFANYFNEAKTTQPIVIDPIFVDLNGDGIKTTNTENGKHFDHGVDGFAEKSAWVDENDGVLAIDKNNDGVINNGSEIFGDNYIKADRNIAASGFDALKDLDSNNDGVISSTDAEFNNIKILKGDGSIVSLSDAGIVSINLKNTASNKTDENGNTVISTGTFTKADGSIGNLGDYNLKVDKLNSIAVEWLDETEDIKALPEVMGSGTVYSLHQAILRDESGELKQLLENYLNNDGSINKKEAIIELLYKWTGADKIVDGSRGSNFDAKKLHTLEQFMGEDFIGIDGSKNPNNNAGNFLNSSFESLCNYVMATISSQTDQKEMYDLIEVVYDFDSEKVIYDLSKVQEYIDNKISEDNINGKSLLSDFVISFNSLGLKESSNYQNFYDYYSSKGGEYKSIMEISNKTIINGTSLNDDIQGTANNEAVFGGAGDDVIYTRQGNDLVYGGDGNDYIDACEGNDTVIGGKGDDYIKDTGSNDDTYIYNLGDGNDVITDYCNYSGGTPRSVNDKIVFGEGINLDNIEFLNGGEGDLLIQFKGEEGSIRIKKGLTSNTYNIIENFQFADGTVLTYDEVKSRIIENPVIENTINESDINTANYMEDASLSTYDINTIIQDMSSYAVDDGMMLSTVEETRNNADLMNLVSVS